MRPQRPLAGVCEQVVGSASATIKGLQHGGVLRGKRTRVIRSLPHVRAMAAVEAGRLRFGQGNFRLRHRAAWPMTHGARQGVYAEHARPPGVRARACSCRDREGMTWLGGNHPAEGGNRYRATAWITRSPDTRNRQFIPSPRRRGNVGPRPAGLDGNRCTQEIPELGTEKSVAEESPAPPIRSGYSSHSLQDSRKWELT